MSRSQRLKNASRSLDDIALLALSNLDDPEFVKDMEKELSDMQEAFDKFQESLHMTQRQAQDYVFDI